MKAKFFKTIVTLEVLSEEPIENMSLSEIVEESITGSFSANYDVGPPEVLTPLKAAEELKKQGSDPSFFGLEEEE